MPEYDGSQNIVKVRVLTAAQEVTFVDVDGLEYSHPGLSLELRETGRAAFLAKYADTDAGFARFILEVN